MSRISSVVLFDRRDEVGGRESVQGLAIWHVDQSFRPGGLTVREIGVE